MLISSFLGKIKNISLVILMVLSVPLFAQQDIQFSQFLNHQLIHNPATAGIEQGIHLHALSRFQWRGVEGEPQSQAFSAEIPVPYLKSGWGLMLANSLEGAWRISNAHFTYAYHHKLKRKTYLSAGIGVGIQQQMLNTQKIITPEGGNLTETSIVDDLLNSRNTPSAIAPSVNAGLLLRTNNLQVGISFDGQLFSEFNFSDLNTNITNPVKLALQLSYQYQISQKWLLKPNLQFKTSLLYNQLDFGLIADWNKFFEAGILMRGYNNSNIDAFVGLLGVNLKENLKVNYSFDYTISNFNYVSIGTHEIGIHYVIKMKNSVKNIKKIYNTRYL